MTLPLWVSSLPGRERVCGESTVDQGNVRLVIFIVQINEEIPQLTSG